MTTEREAMDQIIAERDPSWPRLLLEQERSAHNLLMVEALSGEAQRLADMVDAITKLHTAVVDGHGTVIDRVTCKADNHVWPCPTAQILWPTA